MTKKLLYISLVLTTLVACNEAIEDLNTSSPSKTNLSSTNAGVDQDQSTITEINTDNKSNTSILDDYQISFSKFIYLHKTENKILVRYDFFPRDYKLCQQLTYDQIKNPNGCKMDKTIVLPCVFKSIIENDLLSINISAKSEEQGCKNNIVVDLNDATFTVEGLIFDSSQIDNFAEDFEFYISKKGFMDAKDGSGLTFDSQEVDLEEVYDRILEKRTD